MTALCLVHLEEYFQGIEPWPPLMNDLMSGRPIPRQKGLLV